MWVAGDGVADSDESCDSVDLNMTVCADRGYTHGTLTGAASCEFDGSNCNTCGNQVMSW